MNELSYLEHSSQLSQIIKDYWIYLLGLFILIAYGYFTKAKKTIKSMFKGGG
jgi:hypothetical protein